MKKKLYLILFMLLAVLGYSVTAQNLQPGYIDCGPSGTDFNIRVWAGAEDDNFFISRVAPKARFTDKTTQVITDMVPWWTWTKSTGLKPENFSRKLLMWTPLSFHGKGEDYGPLPNGIFNNEVFTMWQYVSHFGLWSSDFMHVPGNVADVAHKNGVSVSTHFASSRDDDMSKWGPVIKTFSANLTKVENYLKHYGFDAIGYSSEWKNPRYNEMFVKVNQSISKLNNTRYRSLKDPVTGKNTFAAENMWYDGVTETSGPSFDNGLNRTTDSFFGLGNSIASSIFFNYNWNANYSGYTTTPGKAYLESSADYAKNTMSRNPFDLYAGFNLRGKEPMVTSTGKNNSEDKRWTYLQHCPISIGLWSGYATNMFWEARNARGSKDEQAQDTYQKTLERWFTNSRNGVSNPVYAADPNFKIDESLDNDIEKDFFGMSKFVEAQSTLCWDLDKEPFITYFNVGNGRFFNWCGVTRHKKEWYNIGVQDYMPTWRWWWSSEKLGRETATATTSLTAEFAWNDAWFGGSSLRIKGTDNDANPDYLHLFKTRYQIKINDTITVRYKVHKGSANLSLVLGYGSNAAGTNCLKWDEDIASDDDAFKLMTKSNVPLAVWVEKKIVIPSTVRENLAVIGLRFDNAEELDMNIGEISVKRGKYGIPPAPKITKAEILGFNMHGVDGKVIFKIEEPGNTLPYNIDHKVSMFKIYAKIIYQDGTETVTLTGATTSWAGIFFKAPYDKKKLEHNGTVRIGVSAVGLDGVTESEIVWKDAGVLSYDNVVSKVDYSISDEIVISNEFITDGEEFAVRYADPRHAAAEEWRLEGPLTNTNAEGVSAGTVKFGKGPGFLAIADVSSVTPKNTNMPAGFYNLIVKEGNVERKFNAFVQIYNPGVEKPRIDKFVALDGDGASSLISEVTDATAKTILFDEFPEVTFKWADERINPILAETHTALPGAGVKVYQNDSDTRFGTSRLRFYYEAGPKSIGTASNAVRLDDKAVGVAARDLDLSQRKQSFTVAFWVKIKSINAKSWLLNIRDPENDRWPLRAKGLTWTSMDKDGNFTGVHFRCGTQELDYHTLDYNNQKLERHAWYHLAFVFDRSGNYDYFSMYINGERITDREQIKDWLDFKDTYTIGIGGIAGKGEYAGFDGMIDNFQIYNTPLDIEAVKASMTENEFVNNPSLVGFWDFEKDASGKVYDYTPGREGYYNKVKKYENARLIQHYYPADPADNELQKKVPVSHKDNAGYPAFRSGAREVKVFPEYEIIGCRSYDILPVGTSDNSAEITGTPYVRQCEIEPVAEQTYSTAAANGVTRNESDEMGQFGYAEFTFPDPGPNCINVYTCKLVLDNGIGTDECLYRYVYVTRQKSAITTTVEDIVSEEFGVKIFPNPVVENMYVAVDKDGNYTVRIFGMCGQTVAQTTVDVRAGECIALKPEIPEGLYAVQVICDGVVVKTQKMVKK